MYKRKLFESMDELLKFLNDNRISEQSIVAIMPFQVAHTSGYEQLRREYELVYKDIDNEE